ncbi:MAG: M20/M25/M40 family metallo-hydrolase [Coriobacteriales bacterium]|nr:M20/M25/M40 family metallo-hydrolase [Coriobacteriales bacterium]
MHNKQSQYIFQKSRCKQQNKLIACAIIITFICSIGAFSLCACNQAKVTKVGPGGFPNTVAENTQINPKYADNARQLAQCAIDEFMAFSKIPRKSEHVEKIRQYLLDWGKQNNVETQLDTSGCVFMDLPASAGYEKNPGIILQVHMDMVVEVDPSYTNFDPINDHIDAVYDEKTGVINSKENRTNCGADDGAGMCVCLAIAKSKNIAHGPIRIIFTYDEETSQKGSIELSPEVLNYDYLINLDHSRIGDVCISSAGFLEEHLIQTYSLQTLRNNMCALNIHVDGLTGGHSGMDIQKPRNSATRIATALFKALNDADIPYCLCNANSGTVPNVIASTLDLAFAIDKNDLDKVQQTINEEVQKQREAYSEDKDFNFNMEQIDISTVKCVSQNDSKNITNALMSIPNGVISMSKDDPNTPETSCNIGVLTLKDGKLNITCSYRFNKDYKDEAKAKLQKICDDNGLIIDESAENSVNNWNAEGDNNLSDLYLNALKDGSNLEGYKTTIHAGLELANFVPKHQGIKMIAIGCDTIDEHMLTERFYTKSLPAMFASLLSLFENIK